MAEIVFDFDKDGNTTIKVNGVKGSSCSDLTKQVVDLLGGRSQETKTGDFYAPADSSVRLRTR